MKAKTDQTQIDERQRPTYHFLPPANWMNDPNGLVQRNRQYHLFYQYNPNGAFWGTIHWGHAVSADLVHWEDWPVALAPEAGGPDEDGCWSGCLVNDDGILTIIYSGSRNDRRRPCLATSADGLRTWQKYTGNPVIAAPPHGLTVNGFRDHRVWREEKVWYHVIGSGIVDVGGTALLYRSEDLVHWEYMHPLYQSDQTQTEPLWCGTMWECPDFFPLGEKHVLVVSVHNQNAGTALYNLCFVGCYVDHEFKPESCRKLDFGGADFYAPQTFLNDQGRRIMFGWLPEKQSKEAQRASGWSGVMSLPRVLTLRSDDVVAVSPATEVKMLRDKHFSLRETLLNSDVSGLLDGVRGDCLEIIAEFQVNSADRFGLKVRCSPDGSEETQIVYDCQTKLLTIVRERSSRRSDVEKTNHSGQVELLSGRRLRLHVFLDRSVIEVFVNDWACFTSRIYPSQPDSLGLDAFSIGGDTVLRSLDIWEMRSIWSEGEPRFIPG